MMTREEMLNEIIRMRGFEDKWTIWFAEIVADETVTDAGCAIAMVNVMAIPPTDEMLEG